MIRVVQTTPGLDSLDDWGVCSGCKELLIYGERFTHGCPGFYVDTSWNARVNPRNEQWKPGYRFSVSQASGAATGRKPRNWRMTARTYHVYFEIDQDGNLRWRGGVKASADTLASVEALYARERPGSNWYPGAGD